MKRTAVIAMLVLAFALAACGASRASKYLEPVAEPAMPMPAATMGADFYMGGVAPSGESYAAAPQAIDRNVQDYAPASAERLVIRNADLTIVVKDVPGRVKAIDAMAKAMGGFVVSANIYETYSSMGEQVPQASIVIRVPSDRLEDALEQIKAGTSEVTNENQSGQDVTDQHVDLESRLKAKLAAEEQMLEIMQEARRTEDVLAVYAQLQQIQSDIEVLRGQIKYLEQSSALSAISVNIIMEETVKPVEIGPWKLDVAASEALQALLEFWRAFADAAVRFFLFTVPALITIAIPFVLLFLLARWLFRKLRKPAPAAAPMETPKKK